MKHSVTPAIEQLIRKYVHPAYNVNVESFPLGCCEPCKRSMYKCKKAEETNQNLDSLKKKEWDLFKLENIHVPRTSAVCAECPCPICHCAHYNPLGITGKKDVKNKPVINPDGGKMECETQPPVTGRGRSSSRGLCSICGQVTGRGLSHPCRPGDLKMVKQGNVDQA